MTGVITIMAEKTLKQLVNDEAKLNASIKKLADQQKVAKASLLKLKADIKAKKIAEKAQGTAKKATAKKATAKKSTKKSVKKAK